MKDERIKINSVVQVNEHAQKGYYGCLFQVNEVKNFGVLAWMQIPMEGRVYVRFDWHEIDYIGEAVMIPKE